MILTVKNINYCAIVVALKDFVTLSNCDNVKGALIFGNHVIVSKDAKEGDVGLFFPTETALHKNFLGPNNLYRKHEYGNAEEGKTGFFEEHGRVKAMKFRGHKSEGFWIPLNSIDGVKGGDGFCKFPSLELKVGDEFDTIDGLEICKKYVPKSLGRAKSERGPRGKTPKVEDQLIEGQFRFHYDTEQLRRNSFKIKPNNIVSISDKWHGTSVIVANLLSKVNHSWLQRLIARLFKIKLRETEYAPTAASRRVIKSVGGEAKSGAQHYYSSDIWSQVAEEVQEKIPKGYTVYGEIVGWTKDGAPIQKGYHYGCPPGEHRLMVYRVTVTNEDGRVAELAWEPMKQFCQKYGLEPVLEFYHGTAYNFVAKYHPDESLDMVTVDKGDPNNIKFVSMDGTEKEFGDAFVEALEHMYLEKMCKHNRNEVPAEGVVVRIDRLEEAEAYKLKSFLFLEWETKQLDKGEVDLETQESEPDPATV